MYNVLIDSQFVSISASMSRLGKKWKKGQEISGFLFGDVYDMCGMRVRGVYAVSLDNTRVMRVKTTVSRHALQVVRDSKK